MRAWDGIRADLSSVADEGHASLVNVSFLIGGELRRRPALDGDSRINEAGTLVSEWTDFFGVPYIVFNNSGTLKSVKLSDGTETSLSTGLNTGIRGCFARSNGRLYFVNDFNAMQRIATGDQAAGSAGISAPAAAIGAPVATTGVTSSGVHGCRYRYFDSKSLYMSDPSDQLDVTCTGVGTTLQFDIGTAGTQIIRSTDAKVDQVIIELTDAGSSTFYRAATVNQALTGTTISMTDTTLRLQTTAARDGDFGHQPPPLVANIVEHRGRLFGFGTTVVTITGVTVSTSSTPTFTVTGSTMASGWAGRLVKVASDTKYYRISAMSGTGLGVFSETYTGSAGVKTGVQVFSATPDMLYWTRAGFPESWNLASYARRVMQNESDVPSGLISHHEVLHLFGQRSMRLLDYNQDPATGQLLQIPTDLGLWNQRCLISANGRIYGWGRSGVFTINGLMPKHLSRPIDALINGSTSTSTYNVNVAQFEQFHGVYDPRERCITWFYCTSADTYPQHGIVFDVDTGRWLLCTFKQGIRSSTLVTGGTSNATRALVADANGYSWYLKPDQFDGVPSAMSGGVVTVTTTGATTTVFTVSEALPTGTTDLAGVIAVYSGQEKLVSSNTANTITLASALTAAPTNGSEVFLGQINVSLLTKWLSFQALNNKKRPTYLMVAMVPGTSAGKLTVKIYLDYSTTAFVYTKGSGDTDPDGVTITNGSSSVSVDLDGGNGDGVAYVPLPALWNRVIQAEISTTRPQNIFKLIDLQWVFGDTNASVAVEGT